MEKEKFFRQLEVTGRHKNASKYIVRRLAEYYLEQGEFDSAAIFFREALVRGLDSSYIIDLQKEYPSLKVF